MKLKPGLFCLLLCISVSLYAVPARPGVIRHFQPDGTVVEYTIQGDEFGHISKTLDGCAVDIDADGWLCYVNFSPEGKRNRTGYHVGASVPSEVLSASRAIPYTALSRRSAVNRMERSVRTKAQSTNNTIVLLVQFQDLQFKYDRQMFVDLITKDNYSYEGATGSVIEYFKDQYGGSIPFGFEVGPVVTLSRGYAYYGENDEKGEDIRPQEAVVEACRLADDQVDFSRYDNVYIFYAGGSPADGGASADHIWPHSWSLRSAGVNLILDNKRIDNYSMSAELMKVDRGMYFTGIGSFCHEYAHILGMPDLYDTDYEKSGGSANGVFGSTSLMDGGNYNNCSRTPPNFNALERMGLQLAVPEIVREGEQYKMTPAPSGGTIYKMVTDCKEEFYLMEYRQNTGWDMYIGGSGMLIYHVDCSMRDAGYSAKYEKNLTAFDRWYYNEINCNPEHQCGYLVPSDPGASSASSAFWPKGSRDCLTPSTEPKLMFWSGAEAMLSISHIAFDGNSRMSFMVSGPIFFDSQDVYQDAAILTWHTDLENFRNAPSWAVWTGKDGVKHEQRAEPLESGKYACTLEGLEPGASYLVKLELRENGEALHTMNVQFATNSIGGQPFIFVHNSRGTSGRFPRGAKIPLRVYNATDVLHVRWTMNGREISVGKDGYYEILADGELRAEVEYKDGTTEILYKKVTVK